MLQDYPHLFVYCCDFSPRAVDFVKQHEQYDAERCKAFQCDLTAAPLAPELRPDGVDCVTMLFVLSAISPECFPSVARNVFEALKPGGLVLFRDYGLYDHAMQRFKPGHKLAENFYVRQVSHLFSQSSCGLMPVKSVVMGVCWVIDRMEPEHTTSRRMCCGHALRRLGLRRMSAPTCQKRQPTARWACVSLEYLFRRNFGFLRAPAAIRKGHMARLRDVLMSTTVAI